MATTFGRVRVYGDGRKIVELPKQDANRFAIGALVVMKEVNPMEIDMSLNRPLKPSEDKSGGSHEQ